MFNNDKIKELEIAVGGHSADIARLRELTWRALGDIDRILAYLDVEKVTINETVLKPKLRDGLTPQSAMKPIVERRRARKKAVNKERHDGTQTGPV